METAAAVWADRHMPAAAIVDQCRAYVASGVVDGALIPDVLAHFIPTQLWRPENTPLAGMMGDPNSNCDPFVVAGYVAGQVPELALHLTTDSVRRGPAELIEAMLTLAHLTHGRATVHVGGGEIKQTGPFGHPTNQGMSRMSDLFQIYRKVMDSDGPFDFEGRRWTFKGACLGSAMEHKPEFWGLGAGPKLLEHAAAHADGLSTAAKLALQTPEQLSEAITKLRRRVEEHGRDVSEFRVGLWVAVLLFDDDEEFKAAAANPIIKYLSGAVGRFETDRWADEGDGFALPLPQDWTYYKHLLPYTTSDADVSAIVDNVTVGHVERAWFCGSPREVADQIRPYLVEGVDWITPFDIMPICNGDAEGGTRRIVELCGLLKQMDPVS